MREALRPERSHPRHSEVRQEAPGGSSRGTPWFVKRHQGVRQEALRGSSEAPRGGFQVRQEALRGSSRGSKREAFRFVSLRRHLHRLELLLRLLAPLLLIGELVVEARRGVVSMQWGGQSACMHAHLVVEVLDRSQALMLRVLQRGQLHLDACKLGRSVSMQSPVSMHSRASMQSPGRVQARTFGQHAIACQNAFTRQHAFTCQHAITWTRASSDVRRSASDLASATCGERRWRRGEHLHAAQ